MVRDVAEQAPQTVQVVAANGSGASGMAAKAGQVLAQNGYTQVVTTNALQPVTASSVLYATGYDANARSIAKMFGLAESVVQPLAAGTQLAKEQPPTTGVVVMIGPDLTQTLSGVGATATTVAGSSGGVTTTVKSGSGGTTNTTVKSGTAGATTTTVKATSGAGAVTTTVKAATTTR